MSLDCNIFPKTCNISLLEVKRSLAGIVLTLCTATAAFSLHLNLASAISIFLLLTVVVSIRWGFFQATVDHRASPNTR